MEREHVYADGVIYIGKEANDIDEQALDFKKAQEFVNKKEIVHDTCYAVKKLNQGEFQGVCFRGSKKNKGK